MQYTEIKTSNGKNLDILSEIFFFLYETNLDCVIRDNYHVSKNIVQSITSGDYVVDNYDDDIQAQIRIKQVSYDSIVSI